ncbi:MAG TPA: hypothetical protein VLW84_04445 [Terriglobales bacterium]|nr:hypothetical protein [Terriglobales bacterium]
MKFSNLYKGMFLGAALLLAVSAFAAQGALELKENASIAGKQLATGNYQLKWEGSGPNVEVSIIKNKAVVATVPAHLQEVARAANKDATVMHLNDDGSKAVSEIQFGGKKYVLTLGQESAKSDSDSGSK